MKNKLTTKQRTWRNAIVASCAAVTLGIVPLACKQDGSGPNMSGFSKVFNPLAEGIGGMAGVDSRVTKSVMAVATYWDNISISPDTEDGMGQAVAVSLTNSYPLTKNTALNKYVSLVGLTIVNASDRPVGNWQFGVLDSDDVNAFAGPNGYIFVTRGALDQMENEAQLAGVLAHEVTHVLHHHGLNGVKQSATVDLAKDLASVAINDRTGLVKKLGAPAVATV